MGEKRFDNIQDLVADGLITFYLESKAADYIAALSNESNYAESPYVAYNTFKKRQLAHPNRRTRSRHVHNRPGPSTSSPGPASQAQGSRSESSGRESGRESGHSSSGSGGGVSATPRTGRANIPVASSFVEKRRSQAEPSSSQAAQVVSSSAAMASVIPESPKQPTQQSRSDTTSTTTAQQVAPPVTVAAGVAPPVPGTQPYYQNSEQIALHQQRMLLKQQQSQLPPPPDEPPPRPPLGTANAKTMPIAATSITTTANIPQADATPTTASLEANTCVVDGRVSHATNTDGPVSIVSGEGSCVLVLLECVWF